MHLLTATITLVASGCRQTTPTAASGALMPLSPNSGSAAPTFQPFVGQTRVTPPPTGSYSVPNNYLGGVPTSQMGNPAAAVGGYAAAQNQPLYGSPATGSQVIGSGVQQTGWTETGANVAQPTAPNSGTFAPGGYPSAAAPARDPRSGGMQVIDMTARAASRLPRKRRAAGRVQHTHDQPPRFQSATHFRTDPLDPGSPAKRFRGGEFPSRRCHRRCTPVRTPAAYQHASRRSAKPNGAISDSAISGERAAI